MDLGFEAGIWVLNLGFGPQDWDLSRFLFILSGGPKGQMSCRAQGGISRCPSFRPSDSPHPRRPLRPQISPPRPQISPTSFKSAPPCLKSPLHTSNLSSRPWYQPSKLQISPPCLKFALQSSNLLSKPKFCPPALKYTFSGLNQSSKAWNMPPQDIWKFTPVFYRTSALWGRCPSLTPISSLDHSEQGIGYRWPCAILGWLVVD